MPILFIILLICFSFSAAAQNLPEDQSAVRILAYFMVGQNNHPRTSVTIEQFTAHLETLKNGDYNVVPLDNMTTPQKNAVAISFDGGDKSIITHAAPLLEKYKFPYTVFVATDRLDAHNPRYLNWEDIRKLRKSDLLTIGLHPQVYGSIGFETPEFIRSKINNATARLRDELGLNAHLFAYPFGEYTEKYLDIITNYDFKATFGQHSGVAYAYTPKTPHPRFTMTEDYADLDRFQMIMDSLPLPTMEVSPTTSQIKTANPAIGFSVADTILSEMDKMSCFTSDQGKPNTNILGNRVELRLKTPATQTRFRVNCTLPIAPPNGDKTTHWRWLGFLFKLDDTPKKPVEQ